MGIKTTIEAQLFNLKDTGKGKENFEINVLVPAKNAKPKYVCFMDRPFPGSSFSINGHNMYHLTPCLFSSPDALNQSDESLGSRL